MLPWPTRPLTLLESIAKQLLKYQTTKSLTAVSPTERKSIPPVQFYLQRKLNFLYEVTDTIDSHYIFTHLYFLMCSRCANQTQVPITLVIELSPTKFTATGRTGKQLRGHEFGLIHDLITVRNPVRKVFWQASLNL